ncbi:MAG: S24/S26 family peptidase [Acidobacteriota bacterium]|nr:S24/S26 family peptidase [Acidobacteriota bacterium]
MNSRRFDKPRVFVVYGDELSLSGQALLKLMRDVLAKGLPFRFRARGLSMAPFVRDGDVITISPTRRSLPGVGRVVAFVSTETGKLVVHRVVARRGTAVFIRGDCVPEHADGIIPPENLLGQVTRIERNGRKIRLGVGPERYVIAGLSRTRLLIPLGSHFASLLKPVLRKRK